MTNEVTIPSNPVDLKAIKSELDACVDSMTRIDGERSFIRSTISALAEKHEVPAKYLNKALRLHYKQNIDQVKAEAEDLDALYTAITGAK